MNHAVKEQRPTGITMLLSSERAIGAEVMC